MAIEPQSEQIKNYYQELLDIISRSRARVVETTECPGPAAIGIIIDFFDKTFMIKHNCPHCNAQHQYLMNWVNSITNDTKETLVKSIAIWIESEYIMKYGDDIFRESIDLKDRVDHWLG